MSDRQDDGKGFKFRLRFLVHRLQHRVPDLTFTKISAMIGVNSQLVGRYATGDRMPSVKTNFALAEFLECDPGWLLYGGPARPNSHARAKTRRSK